ncbi:MAG: tRNA (adenosine(37)-N6)-dimethylallyltransferase MiaA, partial [Pseudomonadota bacterium]
MAFVTDMLCILGPTASGKTRLAVAIAHELGAEIISADSRQVFRSMDIGTGKDLDEYCIDGKAIPHHLIDIVDPGVEYSVYDFQRGFLAAYKQLRNRGVFPVLCGGTGLYLDAVLQGYDLQPVPRNEVLRSELEKQSDQALVERLATLCPLHNTTDVEDRQRLIRAIEIASCGNAKKKAFPPISSKVYGLKWQRAKLRARITTRLLERLENGLIEEVHGLLDGGLSPEQLSFYGLEYRFVTNYVCGRLNRNDMF